MSRESRRGLWGSGLIPLLSIALLLCGASCKSPCAPPHCGGHAKRPSAKGISTPPAPVVAVDAGLRQEIDASALKSRPWKPPQVAMFRGDPARLGRSEWALPRTKPALRWRFVTRRALYASPVIDGYGNIYIASLDGHVYSLTPEGRLRWKHTVGARIFSTPALAEPGLFVGADDESLRLLALSSGKLRWRAKLGPCEKAPGQGMDRLNCQADGSPLVDSAGAVLLAADAVYAFDAESGKRRRRALLLGHAHGSVSRAADGTLVVGTQGLAVVALTARFAPRWRIKTRYHCDATAALHAGVAYLGCDDGRLHAITVASGIERWRFPTGRAIRSSAAIDKRGRIYFGSYDGRLRVVDAAGRQLWSFATGGAIHASPVVDDSGAVVFGSRDGKLYALDSAGRLLWQRDLGSDIDSSVAVAADGTLYVGSDDGGLYALR